MFIKHKKANQPELDEAFVMLREQVAESATVSNLFGGLLSRLFEAIKQLRIFSEIIFMDFACCVE